MVDIKEYVAARCLCCDTIDVDTRHARICPRAGGAHVNQHHPILLAISCAFKRLVIARQVESGEPLTMDRNLGWKSSSGGEAFGRRRTWSTVTRPSYKMQPTQTRKRGDTCLRGGSSDHAGSGASTSKAPKSPSTSAATSLLLSRVKALGVSGEKVVASSIS